MNICRIYLFLSVNWVAIVVAHYRKCYEEFSLCLITNTGEPRYARRNQFILTQSSAVEWCSNHSATLAIITNETVQSAVEAFINDSSAKLNWDVVTNGYRFDFSNWGWIDGRPSDLLPYANNVYSRYAYLVVAPGGTYISSNHQATDRKKFICSYNLNNDYGCRTHYQQMGERCFKIHYELSTWFDARSTCIEEVEEEGSDLAILETANLSVAFESRNKYTQYWIGLRKESWDWYIEHTSCAEVIYSNWEDEKPSATGGSCLCLRVATGKWTDCECSWTYRYVCIQDIASGLTTANETSMAKPTLGPITPIIATTYSSTKKLTIRSTPSVTTANPTVGVSPSQSRPTPTHARNDNLWNNTSAGQVQTETFSGILVALGIGSVCLLILIIVIVVVVVIKHRRSRSGGIGPKPSDSPSQMVPEGDSPNSVYATVVPNASKPTRSASETTPNQIVYAELDLVAPNRKTTLRASEADGSFAEKTPNETVYAEVGLATPKRETTQRNSKAVGSSVEKTQNQIVYAELDLVPKQGSKRGRSGLESENPNGIQMECVYANSTQNN